MADSVFTKIIKGEIPCHKVYEDDRTIAFMDIHPIQPGQVVVVSKTPAETFLELDDAGAAAFWVAIRKVSRRIKEVFPDKKRVGVMIEGLDVPHVHAKLVPINTGDEFRSEPDMDKDVDDQILFDFAKRLRIEE